MTNETYKTNRGDMHFIGMADGEEYYLELKDSPRGWSFMGLRANTKEELREYARQDDPQDLLGLSKSDWQVIENYFNYEKWESDCENGWYERHDVQAERENEAGETLYLGFGSGQDIFGYFKENNITDYESYASHFEVTGLDKETFDKLNEVIKEGNARVTDIPSIGDNDTPEYHARERELKQFREILENK